MKLNKIYENTKSLPWPIWAAIYTLEIWLINLIAPGSIGWAPNDIGSFGDMFGAANSIFSAFAVVGVAWSISMQRTELSLARKDRKETTDILDEQRVNLKLQRFETTFFQLFTAFQDITKNLEIIINTEGGVTRSNNGSFVVTSDVETSYKGQRAFEKILKKLGRNYQQQLNWNRSKDPENLEVGEDIFEDVISRRMDAFGRAYQVIFSEYGSHLGRYYRSLYIILDFIEKSHIPNEDKPFYTKLVRAQLSKEESTLLALNFKSPYTTSAFNSLKIKYGLAKNADRGDAVLGDILYELPPEIFGRNYVKRRGESKS